MPLNREWVPCVTLRNPKNWIGSARKPDANSFRPDVDDVGGPDERQRAGHVGVDRGEPRDADRRRRKLTRGLGERHRRPIPDPSMQNPDCR